MLVVEVTNDFSDFQKALFQSGKISRKYWEAYTDHLTYFSYKSLQKLCETHSWKTHKMISGFPIEWYLPNNNSNYMTNNNVGKADHESKIFIENYLHNRKTEMNNLISFYEAMAKIGQGRQLIGFFSKK